MKRILRRFSKKDEEEKVPLIEVTPFSKLFVFTVSSFLFLATFKQTMVVSFLPALVRSFGATEVTAGKQAGLIAAAICISAILSSFVWGYYGDVKGHAPALIYCHIGSTISGLLFAFSYTFWWAFFSRLLQGCFIGVQLSTKCIVFEVCDNTNLARAMTIVGASVTSAFLFGPSFAGFLSFPHQQYPDRFSEDNIFSKFKILLPCFILFLCDILVLFLGIKVIPKYYKSIFNNKKKIEDLDTSVEFKTSDGNISINSIKRRRSWKETFKNSRIYIVLSDKQRVILLIVNCLNHTFDIGVDIMFPLYWATSPKYHGVAFLPKDISFVLLIVGVINIILQFTCFAMIIDRFGSKKVFIFSLLTLAAFVVCLPLLRHIEKKSTLYAIASLHMLICRCSLSLTYLALVILISNSVPLNLLGQMTGLGVSSTAVGRVVAPLMFGNAFSWSLTNIEGIDNVKPLGFPFNEYFAFFLIAVLAIATGIGIQIFIPASYDVKKDKPTVQTIETEGSNTTEA